MAIVDGRERCNSDYEQRDPAEEPERNEALPTIPLHTFATAHCVASLQPADEGTPPRIMADELDRGSGRRGCNCASQRQ